VNTKLLPVFLLMGVVMSAPQNLPDVPDKIKAPAGEEMVLKVHATGSQIYVCQQGTDGKFGWTLKAPDAELRDDRGQIIGHHFAGPTWKHNDGSSIAAKAVGRADVPDSIPWLLLTVTGHSGSGVLDRVTSVQRIHTSGGQPPSTECNSSNQNNEVKSSYTADYYFYAPAKAGK
jgi:hypothetical protein